MEKRPLSLTIIAWFLVIMTLLSVYSIATMGSNPIAIKMMEESHIPLLYEQLWGGLGAIVTLICAYGIFKGQPWSRVLYVVWGVIGIVAGFYLSPMKSVILLSFVFLVVISFFLFRHAADDWFQARGFMLHRERRR